MAKPDHGGSLTLHLLDSSQGHPIQSWAFENRTRVSIGRSDENDIVLADPQVSRKHAELVYRDCRWLLFSHGRNGTRLDGVMVSEIGLVDRAVFQLGSSGPSLQFVATGRPASNKATVDAIDPSVFDFLAIDEQRKAQDVSRIAETPAFRHLQAYARRLKQGGDGIDRQGDL